jgi:hypothetical protein
MQPPYPPGPNGLRYLDYFLGRLDGSGLDTGAKLEVIALISGFATMYGIMHATFARQRITGGQHADMHPRAFAHASASGQYPNLAAALAAAGPARGRLMLPADRPGCSRARRTGGRRRRTGMTRPRSAAQRLPRDNRRSWRRTCRRRDS